MDNLFPIDLGELFHRELLRDGKSNDHMLHPSSHLTGNLRHAALDAAGAPRKTRPLIDQIVLETGTMWHERFAEMLRRQGVPFMSEVNVTPWLPVGWAGTADALIWNPEAKAFVLVDFKTTAGRSLQYIEKDGAKKEHVMQASAYWHACRNMGLPMLKKVAVLYWPKDAVPGRLTEPLLVDFEPVPRAKLAKIMTDRYNKVAKYVGSLGGEFGSPVPGGDVRPLADWVTDDLPPGMPREVKMRNGGQDAVLVPHWSTRYCQYDEELCDCSTQGETKIATRDHYGDWAYREGYEKLAKQHGLV